MAMRDGVAASMAVQRPGRLNACGQLRQCLSSEMLHACKRGVELRDRECSPSFRLPVRKLHEWNA